MDKKLSAGHIIKILLFSILIIQVAQRRGLSKPFGFTTASAAQGTQSTSYNFKNVKFEIDKENPIYLKSVKVEIVPVGFQNSPSVIRISFDDGKSWSNCQLIPQEAMMWKCNFSSGFAPKISDIESIQIQAAK